MCLEITANTSTWKRCAPLLGASLLGLKHPLVCYVSLVGEVLSLEDYSKGFGWVFFPCWEGIPRILLVFLCMVFLLVILVATTLLFMVKWNVKNGMNFMLNLAYEKSTPRGCRNLGTIQMRWSHVGSTWPMSYNAWRTSKGHNLQSRARFWVW